MKSRAVRLNDLVSFLPRPRESTERELSWGLAQIAGRIVELSGSGATATLTAAFGLVLDAQQKGEPVAWIGLPQSTFFPPDADGSGVDLDSLAVVRAPDPQAAGRAAVQLVRSGGFGLVVVDFGYRPRETSPLEIPTPLQTRLVGLAQKHDAAVVVLTEKSETAASLGSLVSLRAGVHREEVRRGRIYELKIRVLKDKRRGPGRIFRDVCHGPDGMC